MLKNIKFDGMNIERIGDNKFNVVFKNVNVDGIKFDLETRVMVEKGEKEITHIVRLDYYFEKKNIRHVLEFKTAIDTCDMISQYGEKIDNDILKTISSIQAA